MQSKTSVRRSKSQDKEVLTVSARMRTAGTPKRGASMSISARKSTTKGKKGRLGAELDDLMNVLKKVSAKKGAGKKGAHALLVA